jgi:N-methylhydantoinase A
VVLVNARVAVSGVLPIPPQEPAPQPAAPVPPRGTRAIRLDGGWAPAPVYEFEALAPAQEIAGPALVEGTMTTVLLRPGDRAVVTEVGWLDIALPAGG